MNIKVLGNGELPLLMINALIGNGHTISDDNYDLIVLANYNKILKKEEYDCKYGAINCHRGKIPQYRGSSVLNWQIINGEIQGGVAILQVDEGIDTGDVLGDGVYDIMLSDTIGTVRNKSHICLEELLPRVVDKIGNGKIKPLKQSDIPVVPCYWHHREASDSKIKWNEYTALQVYNLIRASENPYKAHCNRIRTWDEEVNINHAKLMLDNFVGVPGRVVRHIDKGSVVICKDRGLWVDVNIPIGEQLW